MDKQVTVPAQVNISGCQVNGQIRVTYEGREVGGRLWDRVQTAWAVLTGKARRLYAAETMIHCCTVTMAKDQAAPGIEVG